MSSVLDPDEVVAPRRRHVEPVAGEEDPRSARRLPGPISSLAVAIQSTSLPTSFTVGDAVGEEQLAHPLEVVDVDVDQTRAARTGRWRRSRVGAVGDGDVASRRRPRRSGRRGSSTVPSAIGGPPRPSMIVAPTSAVQPAVVVGTTQRSHVSPSSTRTVYAGRRPGVDVVIAGEAVDGATGEPLVAGRPRRPAVVRAVGPRRLVPRSTDPAAVTAIP